MYFDIPDLSDDQIREIADHQRLQLLGEDHQLNFDVELVLESCGLRLLAVPGLARDHNLEAMPIFSDQLILIDEDVYNDERSWYGRFRFTLTHELGHWILHKDHLMKTTLRDVSEWSKYVLQVEKDKKIELQANEFAGRFLVPVQRLQLMIPFEKAELFRQHEELSEYDLRRYIANRLARKFNVTPTVIQKRFEREKLLSLFR